MALALLTACGETDPDKIVREDGVSPSVVLQVNNAAANKGWGQAEYSRKYSEIADKLLMNWLEYQSDPQRTESTYWTKYGQITSELNGAKIVLGLTTDPTIPSSSGVNPTTTSNFKVNNIVADANENAFNLADKMGVGVYKNGNTTYVLVCLFDVN